LRHFINKEKAVIIGARNLQLLAYLHLVYVNHTAGHFEQN